MAKIKPFKGWLPVPILPAAQVQATSYAQHLAYLEWYIDYLSGQVALCEVLANKVTSIDADSTDEQYPSAKAVYTRLNALGDILTLLSSTVADLPRIRVNRPLAGTEDALTSLEYDGTNYKVIGDGQQVAIPSQVTVDTGKVTVTFPSLPEGAVIDRVDVLLKVSGGTAPQLRSLTPSSEFNLGTYISTSQDGGLGYCVWNASPSTAGGITYITFEISSNTLWSTALTSSDVGLAGNSRVYYHIEA